MLYLSYDGLTDPLGQSQILPYLSGLSGLGHEITIVSFEKPRAFSSEEKLVRKLCMAAGLAWEPLVYHKSPPVLSTIFDLAVLFRKAVSLDKKRKFNIVHCRSYVTSLVGWHMQRKKGIRFIFDMRGFWADERVDAGLWSRRNPLFNAIYAFFKRKELDFVRSADQVISLTQNGKNEVMKWGGDPSRIEVIPTCVDLQLFGTENIDTDRQATLRDRLGIHASDFILAYLGSLGTWYMMTEMIAFFDVIKMHRSAKFLVISPDEWTFDVREDIIRVKATRDEVPAFLSLASASVFFIQPSFSKKASSATKTGELLAMGLPIVCNSGWGDIDALRGEPGIMVIDGLTPANYEKAAVHLLTCEFDKSRLRQLADDYFNLENGIKKYDLIYRSLD